MSSGRSSRLKSSRYLKGRDSNSPTLATTRSEKSLWVRSYQNQPIPAKLRKIYIGRKYEFHDSSDQEEEIIAVEEEEEQDHPERKRSILPKFQMISDRGEFSSTRKNRIKSQRKINLPNVRCHSVSSLKLPQVLEEKKEEDEHWKKCISKLSQFRDNNEFGKKTRRSSSEYTEVVSRVESFECPAQLSRMLPEEITEIDAEETKSVKLPNDKSIITTELYKLIVDELDQKRKKKDELKEEIESIIEQQKHEEEVNTEKLRQSLSKFESESEYLSNDEIRYSGQQEQEHEVVEEESEKSDDS